MLVKMKLYYSQNSPYARIARMALRESGLSSFAEEFVAANRETDNPVLQYSPVGRVPTLIVDNIVITEAKNVFDYLSIRSGLETMQHDEKKDWAAISQEGQILGFLEGIANWVRENRRPADVRSKILLRVELDRSLRCMEYFESEAEATRLPHFPVFRSLALAASLGLMDFHKFHPDWRTVYQSLSAWYERQEKRDSMLETSPQ